MLITVNLQSWRSFSGFFLASFAASAMNYLFQVIVARRIGAEAFAQFSVEWSYLSLLFISGTIATYFATLNPMHKAHKRLLMILLQVIGLVALFGGALRIGLACENMMTSLLLGFCLRRRDYRRVNLLNLALAAARILSFLLLPLSLLDTRGILLAVYFSAVVVQLGYLALTRVPEEDAGEGASADWLGPVILAVVGGLIPQIDVLWCARFPGGEAVLKIAELSLISKGVFFLQMILAQFMLPLEQKRLPTLAQISLALLAAVSLSAGAGYAAYLVLPAILHWTTPLTALDFMRISLIGMGSSLFYALVQMLCKAGRLRAVFVATFILVVQALGQGFYGLTLETYLSVTALVYPVLVLGLSAVQAARSDSR